jgi:hypothetical protein
MLSPESAVTVAGSMSAGGFLALRALVVEIDSYPPMTAHIRGTSTLWKLCNREGLPVPAEESCVAEIFAQDRKATGKTGDDRQCESRQPEEYEWVRPDSGSGSDSQVVDLCVHADHGDAWQRQHLSGITPVHPPDPETLSGSPISAHFGIGLISHIGSSSCARGLNM